MPSQIPTKDLNDLDSYRRLEENTRCSNKVGESLEFEGVCHVEKAEVLPIRVVCLGNGL